MNKPWVGKRFVVRYADFLAAGVVVAYAASMTLGIVPHGRPHWVYKTNCDTTLYPYDRSYTTCRALEQAKGWPVATNYVYTNAQPVEGYDLPKPEFIAPRCGKRCGDVMSWNGLLTGAVIMAPAAIAYGRHIRKHHKQDQGL